MGWIFPIGFGSLALFLLWKSGQVKGRAFELTIAAVLVAIAGYAWQGQPSLPETRAVAIEPSNQQ
jgi:cytochrome c-type biogenesis protein CcmH